MPIIKQHLAEPQHAQQRWYDQPAQAREFQPGDKVLVLLPSATSKFLATWQGPCTIVEKIGPVNYRIRQSGCRREKQNIPHSSAQEVDSATWSSCWLHPTRGTSLTSWRTVDTHTEARTEFPGQSVLECVHRAARTDVHHSARDQDTPRASLFGSAPTRCLRLRGISEPLVQPRRNGP